MALSPELNKEIDDLLLNDPMRIVTFEEGLRIIELQMAKQATQSPIVITDRKIPQETSDKINAFLEK